MMQPSATNVSVLDCEVTEIRLLMERYAGVLLERPSEWLCAVIADAVESHGMASAAELFPVLERSPAECEALLEKVLAISTLWALTSGCPRSKLRNGDSILMQQYRNCQSTWLEHIFPASATTFS